MDECGGHHDQATIDIDAATLKVNTECERWDGFTKCLEVSSYGGVG